MVTSLRSTAARRTNVICRTVGTIKILLGRLDNGICGYFFINGVTGGVVRVPSFAAGLITRRGHDFHVIISGMRLVTF